MQALRSIASWATTSLVTVGAAAGIILPNVQSAPATSAAVSVVNEAKSSPTARVALDSIPIFAASVAVQPLNTLISVRHGRPRSSPATLPQSTNTFPTAPSTATTLPTQTTTTTTATTTTTTTTTVIAVAPPVVTTTLPPVTTTTRPPTTTTTQLPVTTTTVQPGDDGVGDT